MPPGLTVTLDAPDTATTGTPVCVDVVDLGHRTVAAGIVTMGRPCPIALPPGTYAVHALLPSGLRIGGEFVRVGHERAGRCEYSLSLVDLAPHAWLTETALLVPQHTAHFGRVGDPSYVDTWMRLWTCGPSGWRTVPFEQPAIDVAPDGIRVVLDMPAPGSALVQIGNPHTPWQLLRLPPGPRVSVTVRPSRPDPPRLVCAVLGADRDPAAHALLGYLAIGAARQAQAVAQEIADPRTGMQAIALGYHLLRIRRPPDSWPPAVLAMSAGTPDGAIIAARCLLERMRADNEARSVEAVRAAFTTAAAQGLPACTEGLRILVEGLRSADLANALGVAARYLAAADTTAPLLAFHGGAPDAPGSPTPDGIPGDAFIVSSPSAIGSAGTRRADGPVDRTSPASTPAWIDDFVRRTYPVAAAKAVMICLDRQQAEDLLTRTYLMAAREMDPAMRTRPDDWLHRRLARNGLPPRRWPAIRAKKGLRFNAPPEANAARTADALSALGAMAALSQRQRAVIELNCLQGMTTGAIAAESGVSQGVIAAELKRARRSLHRPLVAAMPAARVRRLGEDLVAQPADENRDVLYDLLRAWLHRTQAWLRASYDNDDAGRGRVAHRVAAERGSPDPQVPR
ncbi:sigma-70 family RNA polymerase sigma factor [Embleya sp. MST-111070]|uniref:sigma-70 family RNA polymerase sigma factor n=1 Tax=Embleya sp. MST-111070 TaxID=3398231 RepID=UPI003F73E7E5